MLLPRLSILQSVLFLLSFNILITLTIITSITVGSACLSLVFFCYDYYDYSCCDFLG